LRHNTDNITGAEALNDLAHVRGPNHARDITTTIERVVVTAANRVAFVLEARALLIASVQSLGGPRIVLARTVAIARTVDMIVAGTMSMTISAQNLRVMVRL
jgi:hypothetical protein